MEGQARDDDSSGFVAALEEEAHSGGAPEKRTGARHNDCEEDAPTGESDERSTQCPTTAINGGEARAGTIANTACSRERAASESGRTAPDKGAQGDDSRMDNERNANSAGRATTNALKSVPAARMALGSLVEEAAAPAEDAASTTMPRKETLPATEDDDKEGKHDGSGDESDKDASSDLTTTRAQENERRTLTQPIPSSSAQSTSREETLPLVEKKTRETASGQDEGVGGRGDDGEEQEPSSSNDCANSRNSQSPLPETRDSAALSRESLHPAGKPVDAAIFAVRPAELGPVKPRSIPPMKFTKLNPAEPRFKRKVSGACGAEVPNFETTLERSRGGELHDGRDMEGTEPKSALRSKRRSSKEGWGTVGVERHLSRGGMSAHQDEVDVIARGRNETDEVGEGHTDNHGSRDSGGNGKDDGSWVSKTGGSSSSPSSEQSAVSMPRSPVGCLDRLQAAGGSATEDGDSVDSAKSRTRSGSASKKTAIEGTLVEGVDNALSNLAIEQAGRTLDENM